MIGRDKQYRISRKKLLHHLQQQAKCILTYCNLYIFWTAGGKVKGSEASGIRLSLS